MKKLFAILAVLAMVASAQASIYIWNGSVSNVWSVAGNWTPGDGGLLYPQTGADLAIFTADASVLNGNMFSLPNLNITGNLTITQATAQVLFPNGSHVTGPGSLALAGAFKSNMTDGSDVAGGFILNSGKFQISGADGVAQINKITFINGNVQMMAQDIFSHTGLVTFASPGNGGENNFSTSTQTFGAASLQGGGTMTAYAGCNLHFANSSAIDWSAGTMLNVEFLAPDLAGAGIGSVYFGNNASALTAAQLAKVQFVELNSDYDATGNVFPAGIDSTGKLFVTPEPCTMTLLVLGGIGALLRRRNA